MIDPHANPFYRLTRDERCLSSIHEIGGRATDVSQIGYSLAAQVREQFPMNQVPVEIVEKCQVMQKFLNEAEVRINELISIVSLEILKRRKT